MVDFFNWLANANFRIIVLPALTAVVIFIMRLLELESVQLSITGQLKLLFPTMSNAWLARCDHIGVVIFGTIMAFVLAGPETERQAVAVGLAWPSLIYAGNQFKPRRTSRAK